VSSRPGGRRVALALLLVAALALAVGSLAAQWPDVRAGAGELSVGPTAGAVAAVLLSLGANLLAWQAMLAGLGVEVPLRRAARIFFVGQLGKYVPGSIWPVVAQMELGAGYGLSRSVIGAAGLLTLGVAVPVALLLGLLAVPALLSSGGSTYLLVFLALPAAVVVLSPPVLNPLLDRALRLLRRPALEQRLTAATVVRVAALTGASHVLLGVHAWLLARDLGADGPALLLLAVGAFALANVAGLLALPLPAGAGVREAVLVLCLAPVLPVGKSLLLALLSRAILTVGDLAVAATAARGGPSRARTTAQE
jgi:uncharacterized membrane protein YbhN (UPF0104 family)